MDAYRKKTVFFFAKGALSWIGHIDPVDSLPYVVACIGYIWMADNSVDNAVQWRCGRAQQCLQLSMKYYIPYEATTMH